MGLQLGPLSLQFGLGGGGDIAAGFGPSESTLMARQFPFLSPITISILDAALGAGIDLSDPDGFFDSPEAFQSVLSDVIDLLILDAPDDGVITDQFARLNNAASRVIADLAGTVDDAMTDITAGGTGQGQDASGGGGGGGSTAPAGQITDDIQQAIDTAVDGVLDQTVAVPDDINGSLSDAVDNSIGAQLDKAASAGFDLERVFTTPLDNGIRTLTEIADAIVGGIMGAAEAGQDVIGDISGVLDSVAGSVFGGFGLPDVEVGNILDTVLGDIAGGAFDLPQGISDAIGGVLDGVLGNAGTVIEQVFDDINQVSGNIFGGVDVNVIDIEMRTDSVAEAVRAGAGSIGDILAENRQILIDRFPELSATSWVDAIGKEAAKDAGKISDAMREIGALQGDSPQSCQLALQALENLQFDNPIAQFLLDTLKGFFTVQSLMLRILDAQSQRCLYEWAPDNPYQVLAPGDAVTAYHRQEITRDAAVYALRQQGYSEQLANTLVDIGHTLPDLQLVMGMYLRGILDDDDTTRALFAMGFEPEWIVRLKESAFFIPPVADLVTMSVREVFNPQAVQSLTLDAEFPERFAEEAAKQGVSREWAERYWAAHWTLPSAQQGFEMLHRGVIDESQLAELLKALDLAPVWRDRVQAISYAPFTRVDIRRMHALGILSRDDVVRAHKEIGYDDEKAELLTQFVEQLNSGDDAADETTLRDLTRSQIVGFYEDGVFDESTARLLLQNAGLSATVAALFLAQSDLERERRDRREQQAVIIDSFKAGNLTFDEANDRLAALGLESTELQRARLRLEREAERATQSPSRAELDKFLAAGIITGDEYVEQLRRAGWSNLWAQRFLRLNSGG